LTTASRPQTAIHWGDTGILLLLFVSRHTVGQSRDDIIVSRA